LKVSGENIDSLDTFKEKMYKALQDSIANLHKEVSNEVYQSKKPQKNEKTL